MEKRFSILWEVGDEQGVSIFPLGTIEQVEVDSGCIHGSLSKINAGKVLDERAAYVRIVFKHKANAEIMFNIQGGRVGTGRQI